METHTLSGPSLGALMVVVGILVGARRRGHTPALWRPDKSVGFSLRFLVGLCILYGTAFLLQAM